MPVTPSPSLTRPMFAVGSSLLHLTTPPPNGPHLICESRRSLACMFRSSKVAFPLQRFLLLKSYSKCFQDVFFSLFRALDSGVCSSHVDSSCYIMVRTFAFRRSGPVGSGRRNPVSSLFSAIHPPASGLVHPYPTLPPNWLIGSDPPSRPLYSSPRSFFRGLSPKRSSHSSPLTFSLLEQRASIICAFLTFVYWLRRLFLPPICF